MTQTWPHFLRANWDRRYLAVSAGALAMLVSALLSASASAANPSLNFTMLQVGPQFGSAQPLVADLNGDGRPDLAEGLLVGLNTTLPGAPVSFGDRPPVTS